MLATKEQVADLAVRIRQVDLTTKDQLDEIAQMMRDAENVRRIIEPPRSSAIRSHVSTSLKTQYWSHTSPQALKSWLGIQYTLIRKVRRDHRKLIAIFRFQIPVLRRLWYSNVLYKNASIKTSVAFPQVVDDVHPLFVACREGDITSVREMCYHATGVPNVVTSYDMTPLLVS